MSTGSYTTDLSLLDIQLPGVGSSTVSTVSTKNFVITATAASATAFTADATRANGGQKISTGDNQYAIVLNINNGTITRTCKKTATDTSATTTAMCKSIANGSANGEIK